MKKPLSRRRLLFFWLLCALVPAMPLRAETPSEEPVRELLHVLGYLGRDYAAAVEGGKIISAFEYAEMQEFAAEAARLGAQVRVVRERGELAGEIARLADLVDAKAPVSEVAVLCDRVSEEIIAATGIVTYPSSEPSLARGAALYAQNCATCHGTAGRGNGPQAASLDPPPADLLDAERMSLLTPFSVFNTIRLGVEGTGMAAHPDLSADEVWDLAFFVLSLRYRGKNVDPRGVELPPELLSLRTRASRNDEALAEALAAVGVDPEKGLAVLRTRQTPPDDLQGFALAKARLEQAGRAATGDDWESASRLALSAYLDGIEPVEAALRARDPKMVPYLEEAMVGVREAVRERKGIETAVAVANERIDESARLFADKLSPALTFVSALAILLREGLEAALLLVVLFGVIRRWDSDRLRRQIHLGWSSALAAGFLTWLASEYVLTISGAGREQLEGIVSLLAVAVLLYVGFWLHRSAGSEKWKQAVDRKAGEAAEKSKGLGLFFIAFLAVYREVFETVLFYRALWLESDGGFALAGGFLTGAALLAGACFGLFRFEKRLPLRQLFAGSALILVAVAVVLVGKGVHSLQESGMLGIRAVAGFFRLDLLGIYPTVESLAAQTAVVCLIAVLWLVGGRPAPVQEKS